MVADGGQLAVLSARKEHLPQMFVDRAAPSPGREAFRHPVGDTWQAVTWKQLDELVRRRAAGLIAGGVGPDTRGAIASNTRLAWVECNLGIGLAAAATTTIYPTTISADVAFIVADADVQVVFAEDAGQVDKLRAHGAETPSLRQ